MQRIKRIVSLPMVLGRTGQTHLYRTAKYALMLPRLRQVCKVWPWLAERVKTPLGG